MTVTSAALASQRHIPIPGAPPRRTAPHPVRCAHRPHTTPPGVDPLSAGQEHGCRSAPLARVLSYLANPCTRVRACSPVIACVCVRDCVARAVRAPGGAGGAEPKPYLVLDMARASVGRGTAHTRAGSAPWMCGVRCISHPDP